MRNKHLHSFHGEVTLFVEMPRWGDLARSWTTSNDTSLKFYDEYYNEKNSVTVRPNFIISEDTLKLSETNMFSLSIRPNSISYSVKMLQSQKRLKQRASLPKSEITNVSQCVTFVYWHCANCHCSIAIVHCHYFQFFFLQLAHRTITHWGRSPGQKLGITVRNYCQK